jgi:hypothetical protein
MCRSALSQGHKAEVKIQVVLQKPFISICKTVSIYRQQFINTHPKRCVSDTQYMMIRSYDNSFEKINETFCLAGCYSHVQNWYIVPINTYLYI